MSDRFALEASARDVFGKAVKKLRAVGEIPGVIYGKTQKPVHVSISWPKLRIALNEVGGTGLVDINVGKETYTTLIRVVDRDPVRQDVLHVDFYAVNLKEKLVSTVQVVLDNQEETEARISGRVILEALTLTVQSLPTDIPSAIRIDVEVLQQIGDSVHVKDLPTIEGVTYLDDPEMPVVRTDYFREVVEEEEIEDEESLIEDVGVEPEVVGRGREDDEEEEE